MLINLTIRDLVLVEHLELDFGTGMTVLSGETGAGKSILLNALQLALGGRGQADLVRAGAPRLEVYASFDLSQVPAARDWLQAADLASDEDCILGRTVSQEGRSKATINHRPVTIANLRELGDLLLDIHGQHEHHGLLRRSVHRELLDESAELQGRCTALDGIARDWRKVHDEIESLRSGPAGHGAQAELLRYQVEELERLQLGPDELTTLENEHRHLSGASESIEACESAAQMISGDDAGPATDLVHQALAILRKLRDTHPALQSVRECLEGAAIQLDEAARELDRYRDTLEINPQRLQQVEARLEEIQTLARKHHVLPRELPARQVELSAELETLVGRDVRLAELERRAEALQKEWTQAAGKLSGDRAKASKSLGSSVSERLHTLGLKDAVFNAKLLPVSSEHPVPGGLESVEFHVSMNQGQAPAPLAKIASGGELSRTGLAIRVVTAARSRTPTLVFDEVDSGIGGATAEIVGRQLQELAAHCQVICITHLPQVASLAHAHMQVSKSSADGVTRSDIRVLGGEDRLEEIARMLGGVKVSRQTRKHAREMIENA